MFPSNQPFFTVIDWYILANYSANCNTQGAFVIIFFICNDLLNCLKSVSTIANTKWLKQPQSDFHSKIPYKSHHVLLFECIFCTTTPDIPKISTVRPVFADNLCVFSEYGKKISDIVRSKKFTCRIYTLNLRNEQKITHTKVFNWY